MALASQLQGVADFFKVGNQLFTAEGPRAVERLAGLGFEIFLDLKFHDIPNTVARAVAAAANIQSVRLLTVHAAGGLAMMRAAREAAGDLKFRPALLGVTVLTSLNAKALRQVGISASLASHAVALAKLAKKAGLDGVVSSAREVAAVRRACGPNFLTLVPAVRPASASADDQARTATPADATRAGADYIVVGRPITAAKDPRQAAMAINQETAAALASP